MFIDLYDAAYEKGGIRGVLKQLARHLFWIILAGIFLAIPCILCASIILGMED